MSVFISYRHTDRNTAIQIAHEFNTNNVEYYLDVIDDESKSTEDITEVITKNIKKSTHLLAIISPTTSGSWWVPFEIGQATVSNRRICSYAVSNSSLNLSGMSFRFLSNFLPEWRHRNRGTGPCDSHEQPERGKSKHQRRNTFFRHCT